MPLVSILMPMRNPGRYLRPAVDSVLSQEGVDLELIIIDDGSTDGSRAVVEAMDDPRIRLLNGPQQGISRALNTGLAAASAPLFIECDADDLLPPGRLARHAQWLASHPEFAAICGALAMFAADGEPLVDGHHRDGLTAGEITDELRSSVTRTSLCAFTIRTEAMRRLGGFRPYFVTAEDIDVQFRLGEAGRVWFEPAVAYSYRIHNVSITHTQSNEARIFYEKQARRFQAQRRSAGADDLQLGRPPAPPVPQQAREARPRTANDHVQSLLEGRAWREHRNGCRGRALLTGLRACLMNPRKLRLWRSLAALAIKPATFLSLAFDVPG